MEGKQGAAGLDQAGQWHAQVEGTWHGWPSIFDAAGNHQGFVRADRAIQQRKGERLIQVRTVVDCQGPLRVRLEHDEHLLRVRHVGPARVYDGVDFFGAGMPYGSLVLGTDYCLPWSSDNRVTVHVLPDGKTQAYSTLLYQGPTIHGVIAGIYRLTRGGESAEEQKALDAFLAREKTLGSAPHALPIREAGFFRGEVEMYSADQVPQGVAPISIRHEPEGPFRAQWTLDAPAISERPLRFVRFRHENRHFYDGPDLYGNAMGYGRALFTTQHIVGKATRIRGREFVLDDHHTLSIVWELFQDDRLAKVFHGVLRWNPG